MEAPKENEAKQAEPIKVKDKYALELVHKMLGYRIILDDLALKCGLTGKEFWERVVKIYKLDRERFYVFDYINNEIKEK